MRLCPNCMEPKEEHEIGPGGGRVCDLILVRDRNIGRGRKVTQVVPPSEASWYGAGQRTKSNNLRWIKPAHAKRIGVTERVA